MSIESVAIALHHSQARGTAKLVLVGIANHDGDGGSFPKTATLAKYANVHPRRVTEAIRSLVELGEVEVEYNEGGMKSLRDEIRPNVYRFLLTCPADCDRTSRHDTGAKIGRSYRGAYDPDRKMDPKAVERGRKARQTRLARESGTVDNGAQADAQDPTAPSVENSTSDENSTRTSDGNSTRTSDGNSTTKNHPLNHPGNPALVPTSPADGAAVEKSGYCEDATCDRCQWDGCQCDCHGGIRSIVPALPRATSGDDATKGIKDPLGLPEEQMSRNRAWAAVARAALRGEDITEAVDVK